MWSLKEQEYLIAFIHSFSRPEILGTLFFSIFFFCRRQKRKRANWNKELQKKKCDNELMSPLDYSVQSLQSNSEDSEYVSQTCAQHQFSMEPLATASKFTGKGAPTCNNSKVLLKLDFRPTLFYLYIKRVRSLKIQPACVWHYSHCSQRKDNAL